MRKTAFVALALLAALAFPSDAGAQLVDRFGVKVGAVSASASHDLSFDKSTEARGPYTSDDKVFGSEPLHAGAVLEHVIGAQL